MVEPLPGKHDIKQWAEAQRFDLQARTHAANERFGQAAAIPAEQLDENLRDVLNRIRGRFHVAQASESDMPDAGLHYTAPKKQSPKNLT